MKYLKQKYLLFLLLCLSQGLVTGLFAQSIRYGFVQDTENPLRITAVAIPNFSSDNVTMVTAVFSFSIPSEVAITPSIEVVPAAGAFVDHNGSWSAQKLTPQVFNSVGLNGQALQGNDVYQVVLRSSPEFNNIVEGEGIPLFSFTLVDDCYEGNIEVLTNDGLIRGVVLQNLGANFNNQMSVSIADEPAVDIYDEKDPFSAQIACPLLLVSTNEYQAIAPKLRVQPNPATTSTTVVITSNISAEGELILYDVRQREVLRQKTHFIPGINTLELDLSQLPAGSYLLTSKAEDLLLKAKLVKIDN
ncbi:T9SS type A sorting domain-containing protein [Lewinella sp. LCG006]|uniref:T9SS type A sorting domain-containing protein n=1 Tax=Lewinella sp. LCG006 TaxID=3231911 RepID=UPI00345F8E7B